MPDYDAEVLDSTEQLFAELSPRLDPQLAEAVLSEVRFRAFLSHAPRGPDEGQRGSTRALRTAIKYDGTYLGEPAIDLAVRRLREVRPVDLGEILPPNATLVPAPRSAPLPEGLSLPPRGSKMDLLRVSRRICEPMVMEGLAVGWQPPLRRTRQTPRSSGSRASDRPTPIEHYDSIELEALTSPSENLVVDDDVVTRGSTLVACCSRLRRAFPNASVHGFALLRTISNPEEFHQSSTRWLAPSP